MNRRWAQALSAAAQIGVPPAAFWALSVAEWSALIAPRRPGLSRAELQALTERFPDGLQDKEPHHGS